MAHCCDGCVYERPGGQCAREDTYIEEHKAVRSRPSYICVLLIFIVAIAAIVTIALVAILYLVI